MRYTGKARITQGLSCCLNRTGAPRNCGECPYDGHKYNCSEKLFEETINSMYNGETIEDSYVPDVGFDFEHDMDAYYCGKCERRLFPTYKYCPACGAEIDWVEAQ